MTMSCRRVTFAVDVEEYDGDGDPHATGQQSLLEQLASSDDAQRARRSAAAQGCCWSSPDLEGGRHHAAASHDRFPLMSSPVCKTALVVAVVWIVAFVGLYARGDEDAPPEEAGVAPERMALGQHAVSTTSGASSAFAPPSASSAGTLSESCQGPLCIFHRAATKLVRDDPGQFPLQQRPGESRLEALGFPPSEATAPRTTTEFRLGPLRTTSTKSTTFATVTRSTTSTTSTTSTPTTSTASALVATDPAAPSCTVVKEGDLCYGEVIKAMYDVREPRGKRQRRPGKGATCVPAGGGQRAATSGPRIYGEGARDQEPKSAEDLVPKPRTVEPTRPDGPKSIEDLVPNPRPVVPKSVEDLVPNPRPVVPKPVDDLVPEPKLVESMTHLGVRPRADDDDSDVSKANDEATFAVGDKVEGNFKGWDWYGAAVVAVNPDGTYKVKWDDGDDEDTIKTPQELRQPRARRLHEFPCSEEDLDEYGSLTRWSSFEEFQDFLYLNDPSSSCSSSCKCSTAKQGSQCYDSVLWSSTVGITEHPEWYSELTEDSPFEHFQEHLWKWFNDSKCERPCQASFKGKPSMFCWSLARATGYEAQVMTRQLELGAGIFGCDGYAVVSEEKWDVGSGPGKRIGQVTSLVFKGASVGISKDGTAANTEQFILGWKAVLEHTTILKHDWAIKADPDSVIVVDRLRGHLLGSTGMSTFVRNCNSIPDSPDYPMMYGSMEAISRKALKVLQDGVDSCMIALDWQTWGEDFFLSKCFVHLNVQPLDDLAITSDGVCLGVDCHDDQAAAFHPFKGVDEWTKCWNSVTANMGGPPPPLP
ncbi:unnamed protein product [Prorocentrum cordatum]|uniref:Uncharacterized protein n=1 Tax=Prorocentrum cordatum TaxID=2364126 RepID=A0ABN9WH07_9DINO|nr:unnamed protein product [Polarella glacialis]